MAKKAYVGVNGISKNVKNIYVGVNGVPKKVVKGYVGVNGVPKVFWDGGTPPTPVVIPSWDYWTSNRNDFLFKFIRSGDIPRQDKTFTKTTNKIAYYGIFKYAAIPGETIEYYSVMLLSPDRDAVTFRVTTDAGQDVEFYYYGSITDSQNLLWYYSVYTYEDAVTTRFDAPQKYFISDKVYEFWQRHAGGNVGLVEAANDMLDMIYAVPFHEDYQIGTRYKLGITDVRKTIRKVISTALYSGVLTKASDPAYIAFSDNADAIISNLMSVATSHIMELQVQAYSNIVNIYLFSTSMLETPYVQIDTDRGGGIITQNGYTYMLFSDDWQAGGLYPDFEYDVTVDENGNISYEYVDPFRDVDYRVGMYLDKSNNLIDTQMTNLGIDL